MTIAASSEESEALTVFLNLLEQWNRVHNLTGVHDRSTLIDRHLAESLALKPFIAGTAVADIGSGGGLPGIPLAIGLPEIAFTLIESRRKRVSFLRHAVATLGLENVEVAHARAEDLSGAAFATVLARAVAPPEELLGIAGILLEPGGRLVLLTGEDKAVKVRSLAEGFAELPADVSGTGIRSSIVVLERLPVP